MFFMPGTLLSNNYEFYVRFTDKQIAKNNNYVNKNVY